MVYFCNLVNFSGIYDDLCTLFLWCTSAACNNRVDAKITSMKINSEGKLIDVISKHGAIIDASMNKGYSVKISLQSLAKGSTPEKKQLLVYYYSIWI